MASHLSEEISPSSEHLWSLLVENVRSSSSSEGPHTSANNSFDIPLPDLYRLGISALDSFLQANVTGPVLPVDYTTPLQQLVLEAWKRQEGSNASLHKARRACSQYLEVDGVSPYAYISYLELFALSWFVFNKLLSGRNEHLELQSKEGRAIRHSVAWARLRINVWHYKLLTQPSLGSGSTFTRGSQWIEVPSLAARIVDGIETVRKQVIGEVWNTDESWSPNDKTLFLVEAANNFIMLGMAEKAKEATREATETSRLQYALSGALGKRTKFQEKDISQLVVLAKSADGMSQDDIPSASIGEAEETKPEALQLNNDTLLEEISFKRDNNGHEEQPATLPPALADLAPDNQPQLSPLDQIVLLTEATIKDAFSPADSLTSEEILPYAVRVLADKSTNWQIYTQALLVRSRIEVHRSRTMERGVLQLQAVADQVLSDTTNSEESTRKSQDDSPQPDVPAIQVTDSENKPKGPQPNVPTTFFPAIKPSESAPASVRLRYIHALCSPPKWHLESEVAYAWAGVGSLISALEIFKRLRLWAEVALCLASAAAASERDEDGRGRGGEEKARGIIRWRLFQRTGEEARPGTEPDDEGVEDVTLLKAAMYQGPERTPPPPNAPRLWCILGELENQPEHYLRAWAVSQNRYARAQKSLGELYLQQKDLPKAREAYVLATKVNRLSPDMWSRLGDICLRMGVFDEAAEAYSRAIGSATDTLGGEDARTWSNLGSALWSLYLETTAERPEAAKTSEPQQPSSEVAVEEDEDATVAEAREKEGKIDKTPSKLLSQALAAYKKGASIANSNWRIWDNVLTLATRLSPPSINDVIIALTNILRIRKTESALDIPLLSALLKDAVLLKEKPSGHGSDTGPYDPPRGSEERLVTRLFEEEIVPLITYRAELWSLVSKLRIWRRDYAGAIEASESGWRASFSSSSSSGTSALPGTSSSSALLAPDTAQSAAGEDGPSEEGGGDWATDKRAWDAMVKRTDELVSVLENFGEGAEGVGTKWQGKARSAVRSVMGKGRETWEGSEGWQTLEGLMEGLKVSR